MNPNDIYTAIKYVSVAFALQIATGCSTMAPTAPAPNTSYRTIGGSVCPENTYPTARATCAFNGYSPVQHTDSNFEDEMSRR